MNIDISQEQFYARIYRKNAAPQDLEKVAAQTSRKPEQSICTWTPKKSHFM
jgi:hypothetical protein